MEIIMKDLTNIIKEFTYDLIGYILPGTIVIYIASIYFFYDMKSPIYLIITNQVNHQYILNYILSLNIVVMLIISYLAGHFISFLGCIIENRIKFSFYNREKVYMEHLYINIINLYSNDQVLSAMTENRHKKEYLQTKASTMSRFESHSNLIQKYIYKSRFYGSLSTICLLLIIDSIVSLFISLSNQGTINSLSILIIIIFTILFIGFNKEYYRHKFLREKECYMYLISKYQS